MSSDYTSFSGSLLDEMGSGDLTLIPGLHTASFSPTSSGRTGFESSPTPPSPTALGRRSPGLASTSSRHSSRHSRHGSGAYYAERPNDVRFNTPTHFTNLFDSRSDQRLQLIALADEDTLSRSRNSTYLARIQQIEGLKTECAGFKVKAAMYKNLYEDLLQKFPQLIGIDSTPNTPGDSTASGPSHSQVIFGHGLVLPTAPLLPPGATFKFWNKQAWTSQKKIPQARKYNSSDINVAQIYAEDETGQPVSGIVAREMRQTVGRLLQSLRWSGQAALTATELMHEAYVYLHVTLAHYFPCLLFCEAGRWKIDLLISQVYSGFKVNHLQKPDADAVKAEPLPTNLPNSSSVTTTKPNAKRERSPSATASSQPRKKATLDAPIAPSVTPIVQAHPIGLGAPSASTGHNGASSSRLGYGDEMTHPDDAAATQPTKPSSQMIPVTKRYTVTVRPPYQATDSSTLAPVITSPTAVTTPINNLATAQAVSATAAAAPASDVLTPRAGAGAATTPVTTTRNSQAGIAAAIASTSCGSPAATSINSIATVGAAPSTLASSDAAYPPAISSATAPGEPSAVAATTPPAHTTVAPVSALRAPSITNSDLVLPTATTEIESADKPVSTVPKTKSWTKVQCSKATIKFKPDTVSEKNLHMKSMIEANAEVTVGECAERFAKLSNREFEDLKAEVQALRRDKRAARNTKQ